MKLPDGPDKNSVEIKPKTTLRILIQLYNGPSSTYIEDLEHPSTLVVSTSNINNK